MREINPELIIRITDRLIDLIDQNREDRNRIPYSILGELFELRPNSKVLSEILGYLSRTCNDCVMSNGQRLPLISSVVVRAKTELPGHGYFFMAKSIDRADIDVENEIERVFLQDNWQLLRERLVFLNRYRHFPDYIPQQIRDDYVEAYFILDRNPEAAVALMRRCMQSMIHDFHKITKDNLADAINELQGKISTLQWTAIDRLRKAGIIGVNIEKDTNLIVDIDPAEAIILKKLIELLLDKWYIARYEEEAMCSEVAGIYDSKQAMR